MGIATRREEAYPYLHQELKSLPEKGLIGPRQAGSASLAPSQKVARNLSFAQTAVMGRFGRAALKPIQFEVVRRGTLQCSAPADFQLKSTESTRSSTYLFRGHRRMGSSQPTLCAGAGTRRSDSFDWQSSGKAAHAGRHT